jgi:hypothetical protein
MTILRSVGPVISTRRSCRSAGIAVTGPVGVADRAGLRQEIGPAAGVDFHLPRLAAREQLGDAPAELTCEPGDEVECRAREHLRKPRAHRPRDLAAARHGRASSGRSSRFPSSGRVEPRPPECCSARKENIVRMDVAASIYFGHATGPGQQAVSCVAAVHRYGRARDVAGLCSVARCLPGRPARLRQRGSRDPHGPRSVAGQDRRAALGLREELPRPGRGARVPRRPCSSCEPVCRSADGPARAVRAEAAEEPAELWTRTPPIRYRQAIPTSWIRVVLVEGRNRQVRRMTAAVGLPTLRLIRWSIGPWSVTGLSPGEWRTVPTMTPRGCSEVALLSRRRRSNRPRVSGDPHRELE